MAANQKLFFAGDLGDSISWIFVAAAQAFFADIYAEAKRAKPSPGHKALAGIAAQGKLQRHYTLNIDGLAQAVGLSTWHSQKNPTGKQESLPALSCG